MGFSVDLAGQGDFEIADVFSFSASIDGGASQTLFTITTSDTGTQTYIYDDGSSVTLNDPLNVNGGSLLNNTFTNFSTGIAGTGSVLTLRFDGIQNSGAELFAFDNIQITSVPEPGSLTFIGLISIAWMSRRRR